MLSIFLVKSIRFDKSALHTNSVRECKLWYSALEKKSYFKQYHVLNMKI